jgi:hypothetical protein
MTAFTVATKACDTGIGGRGWQRPELESSALASLSHQESFPNAHGR